MDEQSIFLQALDKPTGEHRAAWLDEVCGTNSPLKERVEALLHRHEQAASFLEQPAPELNATLVPEVVGDARAQSLQAGLAAAFREGEAVVVGCEGHSVLRTLGRMIDKVPRVALRDSVEERAEPIVRPTSPEMPQRNSDSRYQLQGEIARGGMGAIIKGRDNDLGRDLAIKVLLDQHKDKPEVIQRFVEEAQIGGQLQHPGIAPIYELGQFADKRPFFSMKLVKGQTLSKLLADRKEPAEDRGRFIGIFEQMCQTMAYAHSRGVIHRDLKPANIMVGAFGEVQVMDWGLAKVLPAGGVADEKVAHDKQHGHSIIQTRRTKVGSDVPGSLGSLGSQTQMGSVMGTPAYMPPEQALGEIDHLDERADVFGLGAILCEVLTGKPPYVADDGTRVFRMASRGKLEGCFERLHGCGADEELIALTRHCLELEPKDRPRDAGVLAGRVSGYLESVETKLRETELAKFDAQVRAEELRRRQKLAITAGAAIAASLVIGIAASVWQAVRATRAEQAASAETQRAVGAESNAYAEAERATKAEQSARIEAEHAAKAEGVAVRERESARQALGRSAISLAEAALREGNGQAIKAALQDVPENLRDSTWRYLLGQSDSSFARIDVGAEMDDVVAHPRLPSVFAVVDHRSTVRVLNVQTGERLLEFEVAAPRYGGYLLAISPDGEQIAVGRQWTDVVAIHDARSGKKLVEFRVQSPRRLYFSPDGRSLFTASPPGVPMELIDARSGTVRWSVTNPKGNMFSAEFAARGTQILIQNYERPPDLMNASDGQILRTIGDNRSAVAAIQPGENLLVSGSIDGTLRGLDFRDGRKVFEVQSDDRQIDQIVFTAAGDRFVSVAQMSDGQQAIRIWNAKTGVSVQRLLGGKGEVKGACVHPLSGELIVLGAEARVWSLDMPRWSLNRGDHPCTVAFWGADDLVLAPTSEAISPLLKLEAGSTPTLWTPPFSFYNLTSVSADGHSAAFGFKLSRDQPILLARRNSSEVREVASVHLQEGGVVRLRVSPAGSKVAMVFEQPIPDPVIFDATTGASLEKLKTVGVKRVNDLGWVDEQHLLALTTVGAARGRDGSGEQVSLCQVSSGEILRSVTHSSAMDAIAVAPDGLRFAEAGTDKRVRIRDAKTLVLLREFRAHDGPITALAWHPKKPIVATGSADLNIRLWNVDTGERIRNIRGPLAAPHTLVFAPSGQRLGCASLDAVTRIWEIPSLREETAPR